MSISTEMKYYPQTRRISKRTLTIHQSKGFSKKTVRQLIILRIKVAKW